VILSPQDLVSCDTTNYGCDGGYLDLTWEWMEQTGIASDACMPYTSGTGAVAACPTKCADGSAIKRYKVQTGTTVHIPDAPSMQTEIMTNGPIQVAFEVYQDFMSYKTGVYKHTTGSLLGGHAVKAIGWGVENGTPYWLIANSWNTNWGDQGFFKIVRGTNECGIESQSYAGLPQL
jgi:cathepsin B